MEIALFEAKNKLSELVSRAEKGEEIIITRHGHPAARLMSPRPVFDREKARRAMEGLLALREGVTLGGLKVKDLQNEGRS